MKRQLKFWFASLGASALLASGVVALTNTPVSNQAVPETSSSPSASASPSSSPTPTPDVSPEPATQPASGPVVARSPIKGATKVVKQGKTSFYAKPQHRDVSAPLSSYQSADADYIIDTVVKAKIKAIRKASKLKKPFVFSGADPVVQSAYKKGFLSTLNTSGSLLAPTSGAGFNGLGNGNYGFTVTSAPPDTNMDVGTTQIVQVVNSGLIVFDKTGTVLYGPVNINTLWSGFGGGCQTENDGDPTVAYDRLANRWIISQFAVSHTTNGSLNPYLQCVAVSQTSSATGSYYRYAFGYSVFPDYPKLAVWPDAYYTTFNGFNDNGSWAGGFICAYDRVKMLAGLTATQQCTSPDPYSGGLLVAGVEGSTPPATGTAAYAMEMWTSSSMRLQRLTVSWGASPSLSSSVSYVSVPSFSLACTNGGTCIPQPGTANQLDSLGDWRLMYRFVYRKIGTQESIVAAHPVTTSGTTGIRWYEFRPSGASLTSYQAGTYSPDSTHRWMPSISMDSVGNIGMVYSTSSSSSYPSVAVSGRLVSDTLGTLGQGEATFKAGTGSQTGTLTRWGDYAAMVVDPADDCTFWSSTEYLASNGSFNWKTWISKFKFNNCSADATSYTVTGPSTGSTGVASGNFTVTTNGAYTGTITVTPSGAGVDTTPIALTFDGTST
ncbi:MAG: hypothetical protein RL670_357, partial [Actinomycetota bacterium]